MITPETWHDENRKDITEGDKVLMPHNRILISVLLLVLSLSSAARGDEYQLDQLDAEMAKNVGEWKDKVRVVHGVGRNGGDVLEVEGLRQRIASKNLIPVDVNKAYKLEGFFRSAVPDSPASAYFGLIMYDKNKRPIYITNVLCFEKLTAELIEDAKKGESALLVSSDDMWESTTTVGAIAFGAKADLSDLPNFTMSDQYESHTKRDNQAGVLVKLKGPLNDDYPAGTKIRVHSPWTQPLYWVADEWVPTTWKKYEVTLQGQALGTAPKNKFWPGTRYVRVFFELGNWNRIPEKGAKLQCEDVTLKEVASVPTS